MNRCRSRVTGTHDEDGTLPRGRPSPRPSPGVPGEGAARSTAQARTPSRGGAGRSRLRRLTRGRDPLPSIAKRSSGSSGNGVAILHHRARPAEAVTLAPRTSAVPARLALATPHERRRAAIPAKNAAAFDGRTKRRPLRPEHGRFARARRHRRRTGATSPCQISLRVVRYDSNRLGIGLQRALISDAAVWDTPSL